MSLAQRILPSPEPRSDVRTGASAIPDHGVSIRRTAPLAAVIDLFRANPDLRLTAVTDDLGHPQGVIRELDVRSILFNPYGHALMMNPSIGGTLDALIRPCATADAGLSIDAILDLYATAEHHNGLILTRGGRYHATIDNDAYVRLSAERDIRLAQERTARAERLDTASRAFNAEVTGMSDGLGAAATEVEQLARQLAANAVDSSEGAAAVAAAVTQTQTALRDIGQRGRMLADALDGISADATEARRIRAIAHGTVSAAGERVLALTETTKAIDGMLALIRDIATKTNFLALNASIEAARAGQDGVGFAVVASEVKSLARQSGTAARDIGGQVRTIHTILDEVVAGHAEIETAIGAIADISASTDRALDRQHDATRVIATQVEEAVEAGAAIHDQVYRMSTDAIALGKDASALTALSADLGASALQLHDRAERFVNAAANA